ncbi:hypothetical protein [Streptomyces sp. NPDC051567]|uniref:hypothetical protein n=1 Tax=Streptomyces sp. NPDC051567 TaxID=3365660 RepID=UPI003788C30B
MTHFFLSLHVLAAILTVGPVTIAASMFPGALRRAGTDPGDLAHRATLRTLHRICRVYAGIGVAVPVFGFATASSLGVLGSPWLITSIVLTGGAAVILALFLLPGQQEGLNLVEAVADAAAPDRAPAPAPALAPTGGPEPGWRCSPASSTCSGRPSPS